jgi:hypothetical protein
MSFNSTVTATPGGTLAKDSSRTFRNDDVKISTLTSVIPACLGGSTFTVVPVAGLGYNTTPVLPTGVKVGVEEAVAVNVGE